MPKEYIEVTAKGDKLEEVARELPNLQGMEFEGRAGFRVEYRFDSTYATKEGNHQLPSAIIRPFQAEDEHIPSLTIPDKGRNVQFNPQENELSFQTEKFHYRIPFS